MIARLPLRLRLTLAFTGVMAVVLAATGAFLYLRLAGELDQALEARLKAESADVAGIVREEEGDPSEREASPLTERGKSYAQLLGRSGEVIDATPLLRHVRLLDKAQLGRVSREGALTLERSAGPGLGESLRVRASRLRARREPTAVVGVPLKERDEALESLTALLLLGGPVALLLASTAGYAVAAAALRPVEAMRRQAAAVSPSEPGARLPVPPARDEVARLGETLNDMLARQEAAFERERRFVSDASHELRTPLAILKAELDLALRAGRAPEELLAALGSAREETDRLARLAEDLLVLARAEKGRLAVRRERLEVGRLLADVSERFRRPFEDQGRELDVEASEELELLGDRLRLEQAVGNLLDNALRHGAGRTRLRACRSGSEGHIHVEDEGGGFPPGFVATAFERFARADEARTREGSGLGLAIVEAIARAHDGRVEVAEARHGTSDVWLALPLVRAGGSS